MLRNSLIYHLLRRKFLLKRRFLLDRTRQYSGVSIIKMFLTFVCFSTYFSFFPSFELFSLSLFGTSWQKAYFFREHLGSSSGTTLLSFFLNSSLRNPFLRYQASRRARSAAFPATSSYSCIGSEHKEAFCAFRVVQG